MESGNQAAFELQVAQQFLEFFPFARLEALEDLLVQSSSSGASITLALIASQAVTRCNIFLLREPR